MNSRTNAISADPRHAQEMFTRVLRSWASDMLNLQRRGLDRPSHRDGLWASNTAATGPWPFAESAERRARKAA